MSCEIISFCASRKLICFMVPASHCYICYYVYYQNTGCLDIGFAVILQEIMLNATNQRVESHHKCELWMIHENLVENKCIANRLPLQGRM